MTIELSVAFAAHNVIMCTEPEMILGECFLPFFWYFVFFGPLFTSTITLLVEESNSG